MEDTHYYNLLTTLPVPVALLFASRLMTDLSSLYESNEKVLSFLSPGLVRLSPVVVAFVFCIGLDDGFSRNDIDNGLWMLWFYVSISAAVALALGHRAHGNRRTRPWLWPAIGFAVITLGTYFQESGAVWLGAVCVALPLLWSQMFGQRGEAS